MPKANVNGLTIHYQQSGQGRDLVMIHGLFSDLAFWYVSVLPALARDFRGTVYDLRGHGFTDMPLQGYTMSTMAADLHGLLNQLGIERAHFVGHSFGGAVALYYATLYPQRVRSLTLADASVPGIQRALLPRRRPSWGGINSRSRQSVLNVPKDLPRVAYSFLEELAASGPPKVSLAGGHPMALGGWKNYSRARRRWLRLMRTTSAACEFGDASGLRVQNLRQLNRPILAIFGQFSRGLKTLRFLEQNLPRCKKVIVPNTGHLFPVFKPRTFVEELKKFIQCVECEEQ